MPAPPMPPAAAPMAAPVPGLPTAGPVAAPAAALPALILTARLVPGGLALPRIGLHRRLRPGAARDRNSERDHDQPCQHAFHFRSSLCCSLATLSPRLHSSSS